jgi:hypothetical protein
VLNHQRSTRRPALHPLVPRQRSRRFPTLFRTPTSTPAGAFADRCTSGSAHRCQLTSTSAPQPPLSNVRSSGATGGGLSSSRTQRCRNTTPSAPPSHLRPRVSYHHHRLVIDRSRWARSLRLPHSTARHDNRTCICCASPAQLTTAATTAPQCGSHSRAGSAPLCLSSIRRSVVGCTLAPNAPVRCIQHRTCIGIRAAAALPTAPPQRLPPAAITSPLAISLPQHDSRVPSSRHCVLVPVFFSQCPAPAAAAAAASSTPPVRALSHLPAAPAPARRALHVHSRGAM